MVTPAAKMAKSVNGRVIKATQPWGIIWAIYIPNKPIASHVKIRLFTALVSSILLYGLRIILLNNNLINKNTKILLEMYMSNTK